MEKEYNYKEGTLVKINLKTRRNVALQSQNNRYNPIALQFPAAKQQAWLRGRWVIEAVKDTLFLREMNNGNDEDGVVITCEEPDIETVLSYTSKNNRSSTSRFSMRRVAVYPGKYGLIKTIETDGAQAPAQTTNTPSRQPASNRQPTPARQPASTGQPSSNDSAELNKCREEIKKKDEEIKMLRQQVKLLQDGLATHAPTLLNDLVEKKLLINKDIEQVLEDIKTLDSRLRALRDEIDAKNQTLADDTDRRDELERQLLTIKSEIAKAEKELADLNQEKEIFELNITEAKEKLAEYRTRYHLDENTVALFEDDEFLKKKSVSKAFGEVENMLKSIERHIARVVAFKEKYNDRVVDVHTHESHGRISAADEIFNDSTDGERGEDNGNRERTAPSDEPAS